MTRKLRIRLLAGALDEAFDQIAAIQQAARYDGATERPTVAHDRVAYSQGVDGSGDRRRASRSRGPGARTRFRSRRRAPTQSTESSWRNGCVAITRRDSSTKQGALRADLRALAPVGNRRMSANPHANGGLLLHDLDIPDFADYAVTVAEPATEMAEATKVLGTFLRDVIARNGDRFRVMGPDETASNRLSAVFETTDRTWTAETIVGDDHLAADGRVMEVLSEHLCQGWLEGYLLTGRHGLFNCYEAFVHIVDSMVNQHVKWLTSSSRLPWRRPIASLNYLLSSHVWRQDHNGASHQDPGFIDHVANKRPEVVRVYLPRTRTLCFR